MSAYRNYETEFKDKECLVGALQDVGYGIVENHNQAAILVDYHGQPRPEKAEIVVRRKYVDYSANDLGFARQPDGTYKAIISDYDRHKHNDQWLQKLKVRYNVRYAKAYAKSKGLTFVREDKIADEENKGQFKTKMIFTTKVTS